MKINRRQFLKTLPAAALALTACGSGQQEAPATTDALVLDHAYPLDYARQFTADVYTDGSVLLTIAESGDKFLVRPEGAAELSVLPEGTVELRQPLENIYLVSSSMMDYFIHLDALDSIALSGTRADGWYLDEAKAAMEAGEITYAGKYSAPDYECILAAHCSLAIENTMIYHTPEVKEQLEHFGVPVLVERSSYESGPLARMEWIKFIGLLLGRAEEAERVFSEKIARIEPVLQQEPTGKTVEQLIGIHGQRGLCRLDEAGAEPLAGVAVEGKLAHHQRRVSEVLCAEVELVVFVLENAQSRAFFRQLGHDVQRIGIFDAQQDDEAGADGPGLPAVDPHTGGGDGLNDSTHVVNSLSP